MIELAKSLFDKIFRKSKDKPSDAGGSNPDLVKEAVISEAVLTTSEVLPAVSPSPIKLKPNPARKLFFIFQGRQGQHVGMGQNLYEHEPVFAETMQRCSDFIGDSRGISLVDAFRDPAKAEQIHNDEFHAILSQAIMHLGLTDLWLSKGVTADATIGLSLGEITSTYLTGALSQEDVLSVATAAARWDERLVGKGKLIIVEIGLHEVRRFSSQCPVVIELFMELGPSTMVLFCLQEDVETVCQYFASHNVSSEVYSGDYAYHTPRFTNSKNTVVAELEKLRPSSPKNRFYSSMAGGLIPESTAFDAGYWYWMLAKGVYFNTAIEAALADGYDTFLTIGPHPVLTSYIEEAAKKLNKEILILDSIRSDEPEVETFKRSYETLKELGLVKLPVQNLLSRNEDGLLLKNLSANGQVIDTKTFDMFSDAVVQNPYPFYESLRARGSAHYLAKHGFWLVLDYDDVSACLNKPSQFSSEPAKGLDAVLLGADPASHLETRRALAPHFSPQGLASLTDYIESCAAKLLDEAVKDNEFDVVADYSVPLVEMVIARILGLSDEHLQAVRQCIGKSRHELSYVPELGELFTNLLSNWQDFPDESFAKLMLKCESVKFTVAEVASLMRLLWIAGTTTTGFLISSAANVLLHHRAVMAEVRENPELLPELIEEVLRFETPEQTVWRLSLADETFAGVVIPAQSQIRFCVGAANRDPKHYRNAEMFVLGRDSRDHLAFGAGPHYCLGAALSRLESRIALKVLLNKFPSLQAKESFESLRYSQSEHFRAIASLRVLVGSAEDDNFRQT